MSAHLHVSFLSRLFALGLAAGVAAGCGSSENVASDSQQSTVNQRLQATLDQAVATGLPGVALTVEGEEINFSGVAGVADASQNLPLTKDHRFYLASLGKTYTAVVFIRLAADGVLDLDDPITRWLPAAITDRISSSQLMTVRSLLNHTSGIFDFGNDDDAWDLAFISDAVYHWSASDVLPYFLDKPMHFEPRTGYHYSNSNYVLLSMIAREASGSELAQLTRQYIIAPLALQHTVHGDEPGAEQMLVHGYGDFDGDLVDSYPWYSHYGLADGGLQASATDVVNFVRAIMTGDKVLNEASRAQLIKPSGLGSPPSPVALGIVKTIEPDGSVRSYWNSGRNTGFQADFVHVVTRDGSVTFAICANASRGGYDSQYDRLVQNVIQILATNGRLQ